MVRSFCFQTCLCFPSAIIGSIFKKSMTVFPPTTNDGKTTRQSNKEKVLREIRTRDPGICRGGCNHHSNCVSDIDRWKMLYILIMKTFLPTNLDCQSGMFASFIFQKVSILHFLLRTCDSRACHVDLSVRP